MQGHKPTKAYFLKGWLSISFFLFYFCANGQSNIPPIGNWREHQDYKTTVQVIKGDRIYCASTGAIFSVDADDSIEKFSKVTGLNDVGVQCIGWDAATRQTVIGYTNSNLDILRSTGAVKNIGDIKRSPVPGNKAISGIYCRNGLAYISSGLGIIVADLNKYEIKDTWFIGNNGAQIMVNAVSADDLNLYAATADGLKMVPLTNANPSDFSNWQDLSGKKGLPGGAVKYVVVTDNKPVAQKNDSLFIADNGSWRLLYADTAWQIVNINSSENKLLVCQRTASGNARVLLMDPNGVIEKIIRQVSVISFPRNAITDNGNVWVADYDSGLSRHNASVERFIPNGPPGIASGEMTAGNGTIYVAAGTVTSSWTAQHDRRGLYEFTNDTWNYKNFLNTPALDSVKDIVSIAVDPTNGSVWAGSFGGGLVNFIEGGPARVYKKNNSTIQSAINDPVSYRVSGLAFDRLNNLWISNYGAPQDLQVRKSDSSWKAFTIPFAHSENAVGQILVDDNNQLWILSPNNGIFCFNYGANIDALSDDQWKYYRQGSGNGNLPGNTVLSLVKDRNGFIWVGTDRGIGIIRCSGDVFSAQGCDAVLPVVQQDRFAGLLFRDEAVQCMAVDGADRKWIGTKNGVWLITPGGDKIIYRFTAGNSALTGNDVNHITIDPLTGEVFISTNNGICSFRSTATEPQASGNTNILVFPNPVPPGYAGSIAIRGFSKDVLVKITELSGRLVYQTRSLGGQAVWNGYNYKGEKAASGVYLVIARNDDNDERIVTKIVIVSGR